MCSTKHSNENGKCSCVSMIQAANMVLKEGIVKLSTIFRAVFPNVSYCSSNAKSRLLRIPLVAIFINKEQYVMEKIDGFNYMSFITFLNQILQKVQENLACIRMNRKSTINHERRQRVRVCPVCCLQMFWSDANSSQKLFWTGEYGD